MTAPGSPQNGEKDAVPVRLIVRRVRPTPGSQLRLFTTCDVHAFISERDGDTLELEADHRRHAEVENAIRDLTKGVGRKPAAVGPARRQRCLARAAQVMAHDVALWTARIGLGDGIVATRTVRRRLFGLLERLARSARRITLYLPDRWPCAVGFATALMRFRAIPIVAWIVAAPPQEPRRGMSGAVRRGS